MAKPMTVAVMDPQNSPWWKMRLIWLLDNDPEFVMELWETPGHKGLLEHLDRQVFIMTQIHREMDDTPEDAKEEMIEAALCPSDMIDLDAEMPEELREEILDWADEPENCPPTEGEDGRIVEITV